MRIIYVQNVIEKLQHWVRKLFIYAEILIPTKCKSDNGFSGDVDKLAQNGDNKLVSAEWRKQQQRRIYLTF